MTKQFVEQLGCVEAESGGTSLITYFLPGDYNM